MKLNVNKGVVRIFIIYVVITTSMFAYISWTDHWYKLLDNRYYAYVPVIEVDELREVCRDCSKFEYLENASGLLVDVTDNLDFIDNIKSYGNQLSPWQPKYKNYILHYALDYEPMSANSKFIPVTMKIIENGEKKLLKSQNKNAELNPDWEPKMHQLRKSWIKAADKMRSDYNNSLKHLMHDFMYLFGILVMPILFYSLYLWVKKGFDSSK